ncbi:MAG: ImmA/IrrE family metallo-endopeptidase [Bacteroidota bacterium]
MPDKPRLERTLRAARRFIRDATIQWLPVRPTELYSRHGWLLSSCRLAEKVYRRHDPLGIRANGVDAKTYRRYDGIYVTVYNERRRPERTRWTLAHEIGHIVLGHLSDFEETAIYRGLTDNQYKVLEREADTFAAELLSPMAILKALDAVAASDIMQVCRLSREAAENRARDLEWHGHERIYCEADAILRYQFRDYLTQVSICMTKSALRVPSLAREHPEVKPLEKKHPFVPTDENGRYLECPMCGNAVFSHDAKYCRMCGMYLYNVCTPSWPSKEQYCGRMNPGDARFCEHCGSPTLLTHMGLLMSWEEVVKAHGEIAAGLEPGPDPELDKGVPF